MLFEILFLITFIYFTFISLSLKDKLATTPVGAQAPCTSTDV